MAYRLRARKEPVRVVTGFLPDVEPRLEQPRSSGLARKLKT